VRRVRKVEEVDASPACPVNTTHCGTARWPNRLPNPVCLGF
jgi:hypothetical protein